VNGTLTAISVMMSATAEGDTCGNVFVEFWNISNINLTGGQGNCPGNSTYSCIKQFINTNDTYPNGFPLKATGGEWVKFAFNDTTNENLTLESDRRYTISFAVSACSDGTGFKWVIQEYYGDPVWDGTQYSDQVTTSFKAYIGSFGNLSIKVGSTEVYNSTELGELYSTGIVDNLGLNGSAVTDYLSTCTPYSTGLKYGLCWMPIIFNLTGIPTGSRDGSNEFDIVYEDINLSYNIDVELQIYIYDELNQSLILENLEITLDHQDSAFANTTVTNSSNATLGGIDDGTYKVKIKSEGSNYPSRTYYVELSYIDNTNLSAYLLRAADGQEVTFTVTDEMDDYLNDVLVIFKRKISNEWTIIDESYTDYAGQTKLYLDSDYEYRISFNKTGYEILEIDLEPSSTSYTIKLEEEEVDVEIYSRGITYTFSPYDDMLTNNTYYHFDFNMTSKYWEITDCTSKIYDNSSNLLTTGSPSQSTSNCSVSNYVNTGTNFSIIHQIVIELNSTIDITFTSEHKIEHTYEGQFSLKNFIDDVSAFSQAGFNDFTRMVLSFIAIFAILAYASSRMGGLKEPEILIGLLIMLVWFFSIVGWMTINYRAIPTSFLKQYLIAILVSLAGGSFILKRINT